MSIEVHNPKVAILASGGGTTAEAFVHATQNGQVAAEVGLIVCSQPADKAAVYGRAYNLNQQYGLDIRVVEISGRTHPDGNEGRGQTRSESAAICELMNDEGIDHVALMGYMRMVRGDLLEEYGYHPGQPLYKARMTNTHPAPLPETRDTYGPGASKRVLELGMQTSRHTVHLVSANIDEGPILAEHPVKVLEGDDEQSLFSRVQEVEKAMLPLAIDKFLRGQAAYNLAQK